MGVKFDKEGGDILDEKVEEKKDTEQRESEPTTAPEPAPLAGTGEEQAAAGEEPKGAAEAGESAGEVAPEAGGDAKPKDAEPTDRPAE